jgi:dihydroorotate dehydrogenase
VVSKGYGKHPDNDETIKTSVLRHSLGTVEPKSFVKVEQIMENVFGLNNEYWVSYFENKQMHDKKYVFLPETILENNFVDIPLINKKGVIIR